MLKIFSIFLFALFFAHQAFAACGSGNSSNGSSAAATNLEKMICTPGEFKQIFLEILNLEKAGGARIRVSSIAFFGKTKSLKGLQISYGAAGASKGYSRLYVDQGEVLSIAGFLERAMAFSSSKPDTNSLLTSNMHYRSKGGLIIEAEKGNLGSIKVGLNGSGEIALTIQETQKFFDTFKAMGRTFAKPKKVSRVPARKPARKK